jgi:hypothetical protein
VGLRHRNKAQFHLKKAVEAEMANHEQKTYKELLMAFLAMAMTSVSIHTDLPTMCPLTHYSYIEDVQRRRCSS